MFQFICQVLFFTACFLLLMFVLGLLMPILTHPIATMFFIAVFVLFVSRLVKASAR